MLKIKIVRTETKTIDLNEEYERDIRLAAIVDKYYASMNGTSDIPDGYRVVDLDDIDVTDASQLKFRDPRYRILKDDGSELSMADYARQYSEGTGTRHGEGKTGRTNLGRASAFVRQAVKNGKVKLIEKD